MYHCIFGPLRLMKEAYFREIFIQPEYTNSCISLFLTCQIDVDWECVCRQETKSVSYMKNKVQH